MAQTLSQLKSSRQRRTPGYGRECTGTTLGTDTLLLVLSFLETSDVLLRCTSVCKYWRRVVQKRGGHWAHVVLNVDVFRRLCYSPLWIHHRIADQCLTLTLLPAESDKDFSRPLRNAVFEASFAAFSRVRRLRMANLCLWDEAADCEPDMVRLARDARLLELTVGLIDFDRFFSEKGTERRGCELLALRTASMPVSACIELDENEDLQVMDLCVTCPRLQIAGFVQIRGIADMCGLNDLYDLRVLGAAVRASSDRELGTIIDILASLELDTLYLDLLGDQQASSQNWKTLADTANLVIHVRSTEIEPQIKEATDLPTLRLGHEQYRRVISRACPGARFMTDLLSFRYEFARVDLLDFL